MLERLMWEAKMCALTSAMQRCVSTAAAHNVRIVGRRYRALLPRSAPSGASTRDGAVDWRGAGLEEADVSKGNTFENDLLKLIFNATAIADIADNDATSPLTNLQVGLQTGDPGEGGDQTTSETTYTSYARVAVARTTGGWTVTNNSVSPVANIDFPAGTGGSGTVTHGIIGTATSGAGKILYSGTVTPNIVVGNGVTPRLTTASAVTED
jgi:hypothetical protein